MIPLTQTWYTSRLLLQPRERIATSTLDTSIPEKGVCAYLNFTPLLWALGLLLPAGYLLLVGLTATFVRSRRAVLAALPWVLIGCMQAVSVVINWYDTTHTSVLMLGKHFLSAYVSGWFMAAFAIAIGASGLIRPGPFLASVRRLTLYCVLVGIVGLGLALALREPLLWFDTPVGLLFPADSVTRAFSFRMLIFHYEDFSGALLPRVNAFYPWSTLMGFVGFCIYFIIGEDQSAFRRRLTRAGAMFMIAASMGRLIVLVWLFCIGLRWMLARGAAFRMISLCLVLAVACLFAVLPTTLLDETSESFHRLRPGSSDIREMVYEANWDGFAKKPWLGQGWPGEPVMDPEDSVVGLERGTAVPGTHSTISGLLYKGGMVTFGALVLAYLVTLGWFVGRISSSSLARNTFAMLIGIGLVSMGEALDTLILPMFFVFIWIGYAMTAEQKGLAA